MNWGYDDGANDDQDAGADDILMYVGDDFEFVTPHWDALVEQDVKDTQGWCLITGPDGYLSNETCPTFFFVHRKVVEAVGHFVWPEARKEGTDLAWGQTMQPMGLLLWDDRLRMEHWHSTRDGAKPDETFTRLASQPVPQYGKAYYEYIKGSQDRIAEAIKKEETCLKSCPS